MEVKGVLTKTRAVKVPFLSKRGKSLDLLRLDFLQKIRAAFMLPLLRHH
jgi:hypothetical protein